MAQARVAGIVLAGGRSRRMGVDKASLLLGGRSLLQHAVDALESVVDEVVVVTAPGQAAAPAGSSHPLRVVADPVEGEGPLVGIAAGLAAVTAPVALVIGCDMPYLRPALLRLLAARAAAGSSLVVPLRDGRPEPLCSAWRSDALATVRAHLDAGDRKVMSVAADLDVERLTPEQYAQADRGGRSFINVNTPDEFRDALSAR